MYKKPINFHSKPDEIQAYHTERSADSLDSANEKLENLDRNNTTLQTTSQKKLEEISQQNTLLVELVRNLIKTLHTELGKPVTLEMGGLEKLIIETDREGLESNKLLTELVEEMKKPTEIQISLELE